MRTRRILRVALIAASAALVARLFLPVTGPMIPPAPPRPPETKPGAPEIAPAVVPSMDAFAAIEQRLMFNPARTAPPPSEKKEDPGAAPPSPTAVLTGIIRLGARHLAVLRTPGAVMAQNLAVGDKLDLWTLEEIAPDRVTLRSGTFTHEIRIQPPTGNAFAAGNAFQPPGVIGKP